MICQRTGCTNEATERAVVYVWARGDTKRLRDMALQMDFGSATATCRECQVAARLTARDFVADDLKWAEIVASVEQAGKVPPDRSTARLFWEAIGGE